MSLIFCDSFDDRDISHIGDRYDSGGGTAIVPGRTGNALVLSTGILDAYNAITKSFTSRQTVYVGVARNAHLSTTLCSIRLSGTPQIYANLNDDLTISIIRFDSGAPVTVLETSTRTVPQLGFYYVEFGAKIDPVDGWYELRVDGQTWLSDNGLNTSSTGDALANQVRLIHNHAAWDDLWTLVDDFYIADDDADGGDALIVGFAGPVKIACLLPSGAGFANEWSAVGASTNHGAVGETDGKDGDTSYVGSAADGAIDLYTLPNMPIAQASIKGVVAHQWARKENALYRAVVPMARYGGTNYTADLAAMSNAYTRVQSVWERNPATGLPWSVAQVNAMQVGARVAVTP